MSSSGSGSPSRVQQAMWLTTAVAILAVGSFLWMKSRRDADLAAEVLAAKERSPWTHVHALGRLEPLGTILQLAPQSGNDGATVVRLLVREGDDIEEGAALAILDNHSRRLAAFQEAEARLEAAEARRQQVVAGAKAGDIEAQQALVRLAEEQSKVARRTLDRALVLQQKQAITTEQVEQVQWELDRLQLEQQRAAGLLTSLKEIREVDVRVGDKEVSAAQAAVVRAQAEYEASELRAPIDGRILRIHTRAGERVSENGILEMGDVLQMQAVAEVFEADVALLSVGMPAEVQVDASGVRLAGRVAEIGNLVARKIVLTNDPVSDTDARVVEVRIDLDPEQLRNVARLSNARVEISIRLESPDDRSTEKSREIVETQGNPALQ